MAHRDDDDYGPWQDQGGYSKRENRHDGHIEALSPEQRAAHDKIIALQERFMAELETLASPVGIVFDVTIALAIAPPGAVFSGRVRH